VVCEGSAGRYNCEDGALSGIAAVVLLVVLLLSVSFGCSPFRNGKRQTFVGPAFTFTTFEVYLAYEEVTEMLLEYVGLMTVLLLSACWFMSSL
jgi:hypothetical protein